MVLDILSFPGAILLLFRASQGREHVDNDNIDGHYTLVQSGDNVTPFAEAGFFSTMSFWWLNPLVKKGNEQILEDKEIPELRKEDQAYTCYSIYMEQMNKRKQKLSSESDSPSMLSVILFCQWKTILVSGFFALIKVLALYSSPLFLIAFIKVASGKESFRYEAYALTGGLFLTKCFESLSERQCLRIAQEQIRMIPEVVGIFIEASISFSRIVKFLEAPELENTNTRQIKSDNKMDWSIFIRSAEISWDASSSSSSKATLRNIDLMVKPGEKVAICGEVGSGKSTLLASILGEVPNINGMVQEYVMGALSRKTVLLITHQVDFLPAFDMILLMAGGKILDAATYDKLLDSTPEFQDLVDANKKTTGFERHFEFDSSTRPPTSEGEIKETNVGKQYLKTPSGDQLIKKEERETGDTGLKPYLQYLSHNKSFWYFFLQFVLHVLFLITQMIQSYWFAAEIQNSLVSRVKLITIYSVMGCVLPVLLLLRSFSIVILGKLTSESIFSTLLISLFRAPMSFHDSTPLGRILSRVSSDMSIVDTELAFHLSLAVGSDLNAYSCLLLLGILAWPVLIVSIPMIYFSILLQRYYFASAKELMRMNGTTKSSIASHLAESIVGATTIRAFRQEDGFFSKHLKLIDANACPYFHSSSADEWLVQRLEILCAIVLSSSALSMTLLPLGPSASGFIGMALSYGLSLNIFLICSAQNHCSAANFIVSTERLEQYMHIPDEAKTVAESRRPADNWPATGKLEIKNLKVRYRPDAPLVLRGISCIIEGGSHLGIIPQDPTLFSGTVRYNLDPLWQYTDHEIWEVLEKCHLGEVIREKEEGLDSLVVEDGSNWSLGQRQLFFAHRIPTVMDCNAVLAISDGRLVEYNEPAKLINMDGSLFGQLVKEYWSHSANSSIWIGLKELSLTPEFEEEVRYKQIIYEEEIKTLKKLSVQNRLLQ
ncbi:hypothetical protein QYF36_021996 [Acer negundo]|nr:hypothetical protein QYF36_021996 [Acer negundo]